MAKHAKPGTALHRGPGRALLSAGLSALLLSCSSAPKAPDGVFDTRNRAADYAKSGDAFLARGDRDSALNFYGQALRANLSVDNLPGIAATRTSIGRAYLGAGDLEGAAKEFAAALEYARLSGEQALASNATAGAGEVLFRKGDHEGALARFEEALVMAGKDEASSAVALHDRATAKAALGKEAEAKLDLEKADAINLKLKRWPELAANRYLLASLLAKEGELEKALTTALAALAADKNAENGRGIAADLVAAARLAERLGRKEEAYGYYARAFDTALAADESALVRRALEALVSLGEGLGRDAEAERWKSLLATLDAAEASAASKPRP